MDIEMEAPIDDLEALFADDEDEWLGDAQPTANCTIVGPECS
jgi:hypothetical protein